MKIQTIQKHKEVTTRWLLVAVLLLAASVTIYRTFVATEQEVIKDQRLRERVYNAETEAKAVEWQQANTQKVIDFALDHKNEVTLLADRNGYIFAVDGGIESIGWTCDGILGREIKDLRLNIKGDDYMREYFQRRDEGKTGEVHVFKSIHMLTQSGDQILVDGAVLWHHQRGYFVGYFACPR